MVLQKDNQSLNLGGDHIIFQNRLAEKSKRNISDFNPNLFFIMLFYYFIILFLKPKLTDQYLECLVVLLEVRME